MIGTSEADRLIKYPQDSKGEFRALIITSISLAIFTIGAGGKVMNELVKKTTDLAGEIVDSVSWFLKRMEAPGRAIRREDAIGQTAEVSVELQPGATGQILVLLG